jgi:hypothetical protein
MAQWEYRRIDLSDLPFRTEVADLLNDAGKDGWELIDISVNNLAYFKRPIPEQPQPRAARRRAASGTTEG